MTRILVFMLMLLGAPAIIAPVLAAPVGETFSNAAMEGRARNLQRQFRCLVCQGQSVDESGSPFAADVRQLVRQQIADGKSDSEISDFLVARYGDFILMKPPVQPGPSSKRLQSERLRRLLNCNH